MKNKKIVGSLLAMIMATSAVSPVFATTVETDETKYDWDDKVVISGKADEDLMFRIENEDGNVVLVDSVEKGNYKYNVQLPSKADGIWTKGDYTIFIDDEKAEFEISPSSTKKPNNNGGSSGGGGGIIVPGGSLGALGTTGSIVAVMKPNVYSKYGTDASNVSVVGTKLSNDTFSVKASVNGTAQVKFDGFDPIMVKVPYEATGDTYKLVVMDSNGNVVPRSWYSNGYMYVAPKDLSGIFTIVSVDKQFDDVYVDWPKEAISALAARNIINGVGDNLFDPDNYVTRAQFIKMISAAFDVVDNTAVCTFTDVDANAWYAPYVASAQALGITLGYGDGTFGPDAQITREEMCTMLYRAADVMSVKMNAVNAAVTFNDDANIADYAKTAIYAMQQAGIINGVGNNTFDAKGLSTRAQAAVAIYNMFKVSMNFGI